LDENNLWVSRWTEWGEINRKDIGDGRWPATVVQDIKPNFNLSIVIKPSSYYGRVACFYSLPFRTAVAKPEAAYFSTTASIAEKLAASGSVCL